MKRRNIMPKQFKGLVFPSFHNQHHSEKKRMEWVPHSSTRQQMRNLRKKVQPIIDSKDPAVIAMGQKIIQAALDEPVPEFGSLHLMSAAMDISDDSGVPWVEAAQYLLDKFEEQKDQHIPSERKEDYGLDTGR